MTEPRPKLAVLVAFSGAGGVERMVLNLLPAFDGAGVSVDLLAILRKPNPEISQLQEPHLRVIDLGVRHTNLALAPLVRYLRAERPQALLVAKDRAIRTAILARKLSGVNTRLVGRLGTHLSESLKGKPAPLRWLRTQPMRWLYAGVDAVVAVSRDVAEDTRRLTGLPASRIHVIHNPVITPSLLPDSRQPVDHPWFNDRGSPVILGAGRLTRQKDFATLMRAFAWVKAQQDCRLVILGEGNLRPALEQLATDLGIAEAVSLPGFVRNPHAYMAKARLFVLSSRWEGSANVLTEALALGVPVVSTDCPGGSRELLEDGRYGPLVPTENPEALGQAMLDTLSAPLTADFLRQAAEEYNVALSAQRYLEVLGLNRVV